MQMTEATSGAMEKESSGRWSPVGPAGSSRPLVFVVAAPPVGGDLLQTDDVVLGQGRHGARQVVALVLPNAVLNVVGGELDQHT